MILRINNKTIFSNILWRFWQSSEIHLLTRQPKIQNVFGSMREKKII
jgi:hypothetical protein